MTILEELSAFAASLEPICRNQSLRFACLHSEADIERSPRLASLPFLYLTQLSEELTCGHIIPTEQGRSLFIQVRTPFAASSTLKFVTLRTYSLVLVAGRGLKAGRLERDLAPSAAPADLQEILTAAVQDLVQAQTGAQAFLQPEKSGAFPLKTPESVACRATFCTGAVVGTVASAAVPPSVAQSVAALQPLDLYLL